MISLRLAFMGTPDIAIPVLAALVEAGHEIACVYCQPPRPAGRGQKLRPSPVQAWAEARNLPVRYPASLKSAEAQQEFAALDLDLAVVIAYGLILPAPILKAPRLGCINVHVSLLPRWRGAAPIQRAIMAGDEETGVTIMQMDAGLDTGDILLQQIIPIGPETSAGDLYDALADTGAALTVQTVAGLEDGSLKPKAQAADGVTYAEKLSRDEGRIDWLLPATQLDRNIRALNPWPGVWFEHDKERVRVLEATPVAVSGDPGKVLDQVPTIACGEGALTIKRLQRAGRKPMSGEEFLRGYDLPVGTQLPLKDKADS